VVGRIDEVRDQADDYLRLLGKKGFPWERIDELRDSQKKAVYIASANPVGADFDIVPIIPLFPANFIDFLRRITYNGQRTETALGPTRFRNRLTQCTKPYWGILLRSGSPRAKKISPRSAFEIKYAIDPVAQYFISGQELLSIGVLLREDQWEQRYVALDTWYGIGADISPIALYLDNGAPRLGVIDPDEENEKNAYFYFVERVA